MPETKFDTNLSTWPEFIAAHRNQRASQSLRKCQYEQSGSLGIKLNLIHIYQYGTNPQRHREAKEHHSH